MSVWVSGAAGADGIETRFFYSDDTLLSLGAYAFEGGKTLNLTVGIGSGAFRHPADPPNFYTFFGLGMSLYFASQGAGRMAWPFAAGIARLCIVLLAGAWWITGLNGPLTGLYWIVAASYLVFGATNGFAMASGLAWGERHAVVGQALRRMAGVSGKSARPDG